MATQDGLWLHEEIMLLALRDEEGTIAAGPTYQYAIGAVVLANAWISTRRGRVPSRVTAMVEPAALGSRSARKASDGLATSIIPWLPISKTPTSEVAPKRFLTLRSSR